MSQDFEDCKVVMDGSDCFVQEHRDGPQSLGRAEVRRFLRRSPRLHGRLVVWPLEAMDHGQREFGIRDGDGYTPALAESQEGE